VLSIHILTLETGKAMLVKNELFYIIFFKEESKTECNYCLVLEFCIVAV